MHVSLTFRQNNGDYEQKPEKKEKKNKDDKDEQLHNDLGINHISKLICTPYSAFVVTFNP